MTEHAISQASSSLSATTGRSLFARLTSPLHPWTRNLADFHIRPFEPHRQYSPGDTVKGIVVLTVVKPIRITHLTVALHGFVRVFRNPNAAVETTGNEPLLAPGTSFVTSQYCGNGIASLFQDEVILCGEGRLEVGVWEYEFELEFPAKGLPSSIDFERGTISYLIRSTITRPTSIAATSSCDRKVSLIETVDIGPMRTPKPRIISLEPISKRSRKATKAKAKLDQEILDSEEHTDASGQRSMKSLVHADAISPRGSGEQPRIPRSPVTSDGQSEASGESVVSSSTSISFRLAPAPSSRSARDSQGDRSTGSIASKTITTTIELLKAGCLPGDSIPLRVSIKHTKRIKSMHGIIITLYRQGRIDSAPPLSSFTDVLGKAAEKLKHEEYYPKSKTGLGGLSLTSAGSSSVFRKDLSQTFAPIIIDPVTLSTVINSSIRVPEDVFPTITGVPGQMISFRYHIEVVIDLGGKLAGTSRHLPKLGMINNSSTNFTNNNQMLGREDGPMAMLATWGGSIVDTDHIRREKSVVACLFEVIVGTTDSARVRGRQNPIARNQTRDHYVETPLSHSLAHDYPEVDMEPHDFADDGQLDPNYGYDSSANYPEDPSSLGGGYDFQYSDNPRMADTLYGTQLPHERPYVPQPEVPSEEGLSDKERVRRAEERLLPSQPPEDAIPSSSRIIAPTAPPDPSADQTLWLGSDLATRRAEAQIQQRPTTPMSNTSPSAPYFDDLTPLTTTYPTEDKQELERRRLMAEASSPADFPDDAENAVEGASGSGTQFEPTAPVLTEQDEYGGHEAGMGFSGDSGAGRGMGIVSGVGIGHGQRLGRRIGHGQGHDESLPRYER